MNYKTGTKSPQPQTGQRNEHIFITPKMPSALSCATLGGRKRENILWADGVSLIVRPIPTERRQSVGSVSIGTSETPSLMKSDRQDPESEGAGRLMHQSPHWRLSLACCLPETFHSGTTNGELLLSRILTFLNASLVAPNSNTETWITQYTFP